MTVTLKNKVLPVNHVFLGVIMVLLLSLSSPADAEAEGTRLLREVQGPEQEIKNRNGLPLIISKKVCNVGVSPESIMIDHGRLIRFTVFIVNLTDESFTFSLEDIRVSSGQKDIDLVPAKRIMDEERKEYSRETLDISKDEAKILSPYVEDKMQRLEKSLLKDQKISPRGMLEGLIAIELPAGSDSMAIEITTPKDSHRFDFSVMEL